MRMLMATGLVVVLTVSAVAQQPAKPGEEHEMLKKLEGNWSTTMKAGGMEFKGSTTFKMELGGMWLVGSLESDLMGQKYFGRSMDSYDAGKKKFVSLWFDSMSATPLSMEGTYDKAKKTLTMAGEGPGMDGKLAKWRSVSEMPDDDTIQMTMFVGDGKDPTFTVTYKRKK